MSWFKKNVEPTLDEIHDAANRLAQDALGLFHTVVAGLEDAAGQHERVATEAHAKATELIAQADQLDALSVTAKEAAAEKLRKAQVVSDLVS